MDGGRDEWNALSASLHPLGALMDARRYEWNAVSMLLRLRGALMDAGRYEWNAVKAAALAMSANLMNKMLMLGRNRPSPDVFRHSGRMVIIVLLIENL